MEAWIETDKMPATKKVLKVASRVEAWIETVEQKTYEQYEGVASRVEAWIETAIGNGSVGMVWSPPVWRRGLKPGWKLPTTPMRRSPPVWRRGLKLAIVVEQGYSEMCIRDRVKGRGHGRLPCGGVD